MVELDHIYGSANHSILWVRSSYDRPLSDRVEWQDLKIVFAVVLELLSITCAGLRTDNEARFSCVHFRAHLRMVVFVVGSSGVARNVTILIKLKTQTISFFRLILLFLSLVYSVNYRKTEKSACFGRSAYILAGSSLPTV